MGREGNPAIDDSSSGEDDGDEQWKAAISSVTADYLGLPVNGNGVISASSSKRTVNSIVGYIDEDQPDNAQPQPLKHYQIKAQKALDDILEKSLVMVKDPINVMNADPMSTEGGIRLFKSAPHGIVFDPTDGLQGPTKKPRIVPGEEIDEKSKKFKRRLQCVAVDGTDILAAANDACRKSRARQEAKEAAAKEAREREERRIAELKKIRGERWLPSIAKERQQLKSVGRSYR